MTGELWLSLLIAFIVIDFAGAGLMCAAFGIVIRLRSWEAAMKLDSAGNWPPARRMMFWGAIGGILACALFLLLCNVPIDSTQ